MMIKPTLDELTDKVDSKYMLVVAVAKRARRIMDEQVDSEVEPHEKPVSQALREMASGRLHFELAGGQ